MEDFHAPGSCVPHTTWYTEGISGEVFFWPKVFAVFSHSLAAYHGDDLISTPPAIIRGLQIYLDQIESWFIQMDFDRG